MEDLSAVSQALKEVLSGDTADEASLGRLVEEHLSSDDRETRRAAASTFAELLEDETWGEEEKRLSVLRETALVFIPALLPILPDAPVAVQKVFTRIAEVSRPREVVLALNEALQTIEERVEGVETSDAEEEEEGVYGREGADYEVLGQELLLVLGTYSQVIPRLPNTKSTPTLLTLQDAASSVLAAFAQQASASISRDILRLVCQLVETSWTWTKTTGDKGGEQKSILLRLLSLVVTRYTPNIDAHLFEQWFLRTHPKYRGLHDDESFGGGAAVLQRALSAYEQVGCGRHELQNLIRPSSTSPFTALAALTMLATLDLSHDDPADDIPLSEQMTVLSAALSGSAIDAGLLRLFAYLARGESVEFDTATLLIELIMPLASVFTAPTTQTALLKLLEAIVDSQAGESKMLVFKQLLEPENPFEYIRIRSLSILRQQLAGPAATDVLPLVLPHLSSILFTIPMTDPPIGEMKLSEMVGTMYPAWLSECASLLWFILDIDNDDVSGIRETGTLVEIQSDFLAPLQRKLEELKQDAAGMSEQDVEVMFILERWDDALIRATQAVAAATGS